ncbi:type II toxin-antitoxin system YafQ family toxin [Candidatus Peregrinibacteria bacterium]|nr:type II toxin-antitoxin system YafQ family toxin [Candidatus Peregrinibacteria bacterium]
MRIPYYAKRFRRDYSKLKKSGRRNIEKLHKVLQDLIDGKKLAPHHVDHVLFGEWNRYRDCHIEGDWVLIYEIGEDSEERETITFHATGTHAQLFE